MPNAKKKIIYSLRVYLLLEEKGFKPISTMPNPNKSNLMCWVYEYTDSFRRTLDEILEG